MKKNKIRYAALSLVVVNLLVFSLLHGVFWIQYNKYFFNQEYEEVLKYETSMLEKRYKDVLTSTSKSGIQARENQENRLRMTLEHVKTMIYKDPLLISEKGEKSIKLLRMMEAVNGLNKESFWILDSEGNVLSNPGLRFTDFRILNGKDLVAQVQKSKDGEIYLSNTSGTPTIKGLGIYLPQMDWYVLAFQSSSVIENINMGIETRKKGQLQQLMRLYSKLGTAAVIRSDGHLSKYTFEAQEGQSIDEIGTNGKPTLKDKICQKSDSYVEYVAFDPSKSSMPKYRQGYVLYNSNMDTYFMVSHNIKDRFISMDQRTSAFLKVAGASGIVLIFLNMYFAIQYFKRKQEVSLF